jgi:UDP-N-acetylmuramoyl-tripeptide--D-alanyl-D-alanine ligase
VSEPDDAAVKPISCTRLAEIIKARIHAPSALDEALACQGVSIDTRTIEPGGCFFAIRGERLDGHDYIGEAFSQGALCCVVERVPDASLAARGFILQVKDSIKALGDLARAYRQEFEAQVIAITGSVGKTTTRHMISHVLGRYQRIHQSPKNFNNLIGLPLTLLGVEPGIQFVIAELGSNQPGEIACLTQIAQPDIALVTNVFPTHLAGFGDVATILKEKLSIRQGLGPQGKLLINADCQALLQESQRLALDPITFGLDHADVDARVLSDPGHGSILEIEGTLVKVPLPGPGNRQNALAAWGVCRCLGMSVQDFSQALQSLTPFQMRSELLSIGSLAVLSDCYNASPASMQHALATLADLDPTGKRRRVFVCGEMAELGKQSAAFHSELGRVIGASGVDLLLTVGPLAGLCAETAAKATDNCLKSVCFADTIIACERITDFIEDNDLVLIKGSRTAQLEKVIAILQTHFE